MYDGECLYCIFNDGCPKEEHYEQGYCEDFVRGLCGCTVDEVSCMYCNIYKECMKGIKNRDD
jgi:hypothetical protein